MGYFTNKQNSTAESVVGKLTNSVKESLSDKANEKDSTINNDLPEFTTSCGNDQKFSGKGVEGILNSVNDAYTQYNANYRYQYHDIFKDRKTLFHLE